MEQNLEQIQKLLALFDKRDSLKNAVNRKIARTINDTVLVALYELFGLPHEALIWEDMQIVDTVLVLRVGVEYNPTEPMTKFLSYISSGFSDVQPVKVNRTLQLGIPLTVVFQPKEEIVKWFMKMAVDTFPPGNVATMPTIDESVTEEPAPTNFNPEPLTREQVSQLLYFQGLTKGTKQ